MTPSTLLPIGLAHVEANKVSETEPVKRFDHFHHASPEHYHRYVYVGKSSHRDSKSTLQSWTERCKCGRYCLIFLMLWKDGNCITPRSRKYWFTKDGELEKTTGSLPTSAIYQSKDNDNQQVDSK